MRTPRGAYTLGSCGFETEDGISVDFTITTTDGTQRIAELAYDFAGEKPQNPRVHRYQSQHHQGHGRQVFEALPGRGEKYPLKSPRTTGISTS